MFPLLNDIYNNHIYILYILSFLKALSNLHLQKKKSLNLYDFCHWDFIIRVRDISFSVCGYTPKQSKF